MSLFETLNWLDALLLRPEVEPLVDHDLRAALRFARGRVHHAWADAIEFRTDVLLHRRCLASPGLPKQFAFSRAQSPPGAGARPRISPEVGVSPAVKRFRVSCGT